MSSIPATDHDRPEISGSSQFKAWFSAVTVADSLFLLVILTGAIMRLADLGRLPLSPAEARAALPAWQLWYPDQGPFHVVGPAYFGFASLTGQVLGYSDGVMRLAPALFGMGTLLLPWLLRRSIGNMGLLAYGLLLAVSPTNSVIARTAGGDAIAVFCLMFIFAAWIRYRETAESRWLAAIAAGLGLGLASSPLFYGGLATLVVAAFLSALVSRRSFEEEEIVRPDRAVLRRMSLLGVGVFLAASTLFLWYPGGLGGSAQVLIKWLVHFGLPASLSQWLEPLGSVVRYEFLLIVPGVVVLFWATRSRRPEVAMATYWAFAIVVLMLVQPGQVSNVVLLTLPGYYLLATYLNDLAAPRIESMGWALAAGLLLAGMLILANLGRYSRVTLYQPQQLAHFWMAFLVLVAAVVAIYFLGTWDLRAAYQGVVMGTVGLLLFFQWSTGWWLGHHAANDPRESWVSVGTDDDIRTLVRLAQEIARQTSGSEYGLDVFNTVDQPVVKWYLRDFAEVTTVEVLPADARSAVIVSSLEANLTPGSDYLGADFALLRNGPGNPIAGSERPTLDAFRWLFFHESKVPLETERVILWWRSDLVER